MDGDAIGLLRVEGNVTNLERGGAVLGLMSDHITLVLGVGISMGTGFLGLVIQRSLSSNSSVYSTSSYTFTGHKSFSLNCSNTTKGKAETILAFLLIR